jgi:hypothetical protein
VRKKYEKEEYVKEKKKKEKRFLGTGKTSTS